MGVWQLMVVFACAAVAADASCTFSHRNLPLRQPLLLQVDGQTDARGFVPVTSTGNIALKTGEKVVLACPGINNYLTGSTILPVPKATVACQSGYSFTYNGRTISLNLLQCVLEPFHEARPSGNACACAPGLTHLEVGFRLEGGFLPVYEVCWSEREQSPRGTRHYVVSGGRSTRTATLTSAYLYTQLIPSTAYGRDVQLQSFTNQLGRTNANQYITFSNYLEPSFLVPIEDFVYGPQRVATAFHLNSMPLWRPFNIGLWRMLESSIRDLAHAEGDLKVHTSAIGVSRLPNAQGQETPVYLHADTNATRLLPLPQYVLKRVENSLGQQVVFVQIPPSPSNRMGFPTEVSICEDVCAFLRWLPWRNVPPEDRSVACCRADDEVLLRRFQHLAPFTPWSVRAAAGLLTGAA